MKKKPEAKPLICMMADVAITAAEGESKAPPKFNVVAYTGGLMTLTGWDLPVVVDLTGMTFGKSLVANLDHDSSKRVGNVTGKELTESTLTLSGIASAVTESAREVVASAANGFVWQASIEARPDQLTEVAAGKSVNVNGQDFQGPLYVAAKSTLKGFAFVSHGADDNTTVTIAATADPHSKETNKMDKKCKAWIEAMGFDVDELSDSQSAGLVANYEGQSAGKSKPITASNPFEERKLEARRRKEIRDLADRQIELRNSDEEEIIAIEKMCDHSIDAGMSVDKFRLELYDAMTPPARRIDTPKCGHAMNAKVLEAAICQAANLNDIEDHFDDKTLQAAHDQFKGRIGLKQLFLLGAEENGHSNRFSNDIDRETLKAAFAKPRDIRAGGFSTLDISTIVSNTANKFIMRGWNSVDQTILRISKIQNVRNFQTITTVSLTDSVIYEKLGAGGEIKHGTLSELTYTNKADTYAQMLAITRTDLINDDLGALTDTPQKLGNGAMKKLSDIGWTKFLSLVGASFFASGNSNINTGVATMSTGGLSATEVIFQNQTNPDGTPLGLMPSILLVPTALKSAAYTLMSSEKLIDGTGTAAQGDGNIWRGRFRVESSPYISNSSYTGNTSTAWWMLADPNELAVLAIAALNGQVTPTVDTADADFNTLGVQMRGYCDVGVNSQEYRGGVHADGGAS